MSKDAIVGVDLGGTKVRVGKVRGQMLECSYQCNISSRADEQTVLQELFSAIDEVLDDEVTGIGCGVPSVIDIAQGIVYNVANIPSWREVHLKQLLEQRYQVPVHINNDANAFALGELYFGKGRGYDHMVGVTLGTGLGTGIIINRHLYSGANCGAGEIGMIPYRDHIIEHYCAGQFFQQRAGIAGHQLFQQACQGDEQARQLFVEYGHELGFAVMTILYSYDPQLVVFGGSIARAFDLFEPGLRRRLESEYDYQHALSGTVIAQSETVDVALLGAAAICFDAENGVKPGASRPPDHPDPPARPAARTARPPR
jgi:glucokinase